MADERTIDFDRVDVTSPRNRWIRLARSLHRRRQRYRERAILIEGVRPLAEAFATSSPITVVLLSAEIAPDNPAAEIASGFADRGHLVLRVDPALIDLAADTESPQGILAVGGMTEQRISIPQDEIPLLLIADQIRDPGNLGTLMRSALGAGAHGVLVGPGSVDPYSPKVIRAAMGSHFRLAIEFLDWSNPPEILQTCMAYAAESAAEFAYDHVNWNEPSAIIVGNETAGISIEAKRNARATVGIPLANELESLNAAIAGSVILFEAARQRRQGS